MAHSGKLLFVVFLDLLAPSERSRVRHRRMTRRTVPPARRKLMIMQTSCVPQESQRFLLLEIDTFLHRHAEIGLF